MSVDVEYAEEVEEDVEVDDAPLQMAAKHLIDVEMDITPMIDITFLLLIFFLVAAKLDAETAVRLPKAVGTPISSKNSVVIVVAAEGEGVKVMHKDGTEFDSDAAKQEEEIAAYVKEQLVPPKTQVLLRAERKIKYKEVLRVGRAIGRADVEGGVKILYIAVKSSGG